MTNNQPEFNLADHRQKLGDAAYVDWCLEGTYGTEARSRWWQHSRAQLGGMTPYEVWETNREKVIELAEWLVRPITLSE